MPLIMIAEDEQIVAMDLKNKLRLMGYPESISVSSGEMAVQKAKEIKPALIIMDIVLEGKMDGLEAASKIREVLNIPIIFLTSHGDDHTTKRAVEIFRDGFIRILVKPYDEGTLKSAIQSVFKQH